MTIEGGHSDMSARIKEDVNRLQMDLAGISTIYEPDTDCWKGDAAEEESCFVSSDAGALSAMLNELMIITENCFND